MVATTTSAQKGLLKSYSILNLRNFFDKNWRYTHYTFLGLHCKSGVSQSSSTTFFHGDECGQDHDIKRGILMMGALHKKCLFSVYFEQQLSSLSLSAAYIIFLNQRRNSECHILILNKTYHTISRSLWQSGQDQHMPMVFRYEGPEFESQQNR